MYHCILIWVLNMSVTGKVREKGEQERTKRRRLHYSAICHASLEPNQQFPEPSLSITVVHICATFSRGCGARSNDCTSGKSSGTSRQVLYSENWGEYLKKKNLA